MSSKTRGILYIATSKEFLEDAVKSVKSINNLEINKGLITSKKLSNSEESEFFDDVIALDSIHNDVRDKIYNLDRTPYDKTLYLDCDTLILAEISSIFKILNRVDIAAAHASARERIKLKNVPKSFPEFNTGVLVYNLNDEIIELFSEWEERHKYQLENGRPDKKPEKSERTLEEIDSFGRFHGQPAFRLALYNSNIQFSVLPSEYNYGMFGRRYAFGKVKILHCNDRNFLEGRINKWKERRILAGGRLFFRNGKSKRIDLKSLNSLIYKLKIPEISKKLGIYNQLKNFYKKILSSYHSKNTKNS